MDEVIVIKVASGHAWKPLAYVEGTGHDRNKIVERLKQLHPWACNGTFIFVSTPRNEVSVPKLE